MKKITITLPEDVLRWLRIKAAEDDDTVSGWVRGLLERTRYHETNYRIAMSSYFAGRPGRIDWPDGCGLATNGLEDPSDPQAA
ncbi:hypothetical protein [Candidatus Palauibacter sp.]|uniref:hypothetical protein n=1 Tax=Candidatus Palauibacter sp. TaxID=3101350 RepID=UPI003B026300